MKRRLVIIALSILALLVLAPCGMAYVVARVRDTGTPGDAPVWPWQAGGMLAIVVPVAGALVKLIQSGINYFVTRQHADEARDKRVAALCTVTEALIQRFSARLDADSEQRSREAKDLLDEIRRARTLLLNPADPSTESDPG